MSRRRQDIRLFLDLDDICGLWNSFSVPSGACGGSGHWCFQVSKGRLAVNESELEVLVVSPPAEHASGVIFSLFDAPSLIIGRCLWDYWED